MTRSILRLFGTSRSQVKNFFEHWDINYYDISCRKSMEKMDHGIYKINFINSFVPVISDPKSFR